MLVSGLLGLLGSLIYGSFLEWFIHRQAMHTPKISKLAFERHAIMHHTERRSLKSFYIPEEDPAQHYHLGESSFIPVLWAVHFPAYLLVWKLSNLWAGIGVAAGGLLYMLGYEIIHFYIHAPKGYRFQKTRLFRYYCEYHRVHHHKARLNYNIVIPLADLVLRTFSLEEIRPEPLLPPYLPPDTGPATVFTRPKATQTQKA